MPQVPTSNLNAYYTNTAPGNTIDANVIDPALQDIVQTVNDNYQLFQNLLTAIELPIPDQSIVTRHLRNLAVTNPKLAQFAVTADKIADGTITAQKLVDLIVTTTKIAEQAVTNSKLANLSVTGDKIALGAVGASQMDPTLFQQYGDISLNARFGVIESQLADVVFCKKYGFVSDYSGTPQYDGLDSTRITCTDNTQAFSNMLDDCIAKKTLKVYFPAGHYGIKIGNLVKDLTGCQLTIVGDGVDTTIIDYIKEDATHNQYVDENSANYIARLTNIKQLFMRDLTLKATTNYNNINDFQGTEYEYHGAVWGLIVENFDLLRCENIKVTRFNFRGISVNCTRPNPNLYNNANKKVELINCQGTLNRSSGFWLKYTQTLLIDGGEFSYNGLIGYCGTGYGVTASAQVGNIIVTGTPYFHHNYRKGLDTHTNCNLTIDGAIFEDNVIFDIAVLGYTGLSDISSYAINIKATFRHGDTTEGKTWLTSAYQAIKNRNDITQGDFRYTCIKIDDTTSSKVKKVNICASLQSAYNGSDIIGDLSQYSWAFCLQAPTADVKLYNSNINLKDWKAGSTLALNACPFNIQCVNLRIHNSDITWLEDSTFNTNKLASLFYGSITYMEIEFRNATFNMNNCFVFSSISGNVISNPGDSSSTIRTFENTIFRWIKLPANSDDRKLLGSQTQYPRNWNNAVCCINGTYFNLNPNGIYDLRNASMIYNSYAANANFLDIYIDNQPVNYQLEIWTKDDYLKLKNGAIVTDGTTITLAAVANIVDTDGRNKIKITLKVKTAVGSNNHDILEIKLKGSPIGGTTSWGIDKYVVL